MTSKLIIWTHLITYHIKSSTSLLDKKHSCIDALIYEFKLLFWRQLNNSVNVLVYIKITLKSKCTLTFSSERNPTQCLKFSQKLFIFTILRAKRARFIFKSVLIWLTKKVMDALHLWLLADMDDNFCNFQTLSNNTLVI